MAWITDVAYIAGFVDGEGHIGFYIPKDAKARMNIIISNTDVNVLKFVQNTLKIGCIYKQKIYNPNARQGYQLRIRNSQEALILIEAILPYLKVKRKQAELLFEWLSSRKKTKLHGGIITERRSNGQIVKSTHIDCYTQREKEIVQKVLVLNRRGV